MRSYWSRGTTSLDEILEMLTEARDLGEELGNTEIQAEAMAWRVADLRRARRSRLGAPARSRRCARSPSRPRSRSCSTSPSTTARRSRSATAASRRPSSLALRSHELEPPADRPRRLRHLRHPDVQPPPRAGATRRAGAGDQDPRRRGRGAGPWRPGLVALLAELGMEAEARRELARIAGEGLDQFRESLWLASLTYLTDACAALGDEATAALVYPELEPLAGTQRDDRPPRRRATEPPTATSACSPRRSASRSSRGRALRAGARAQPRGWAPRPGSRTRPTSTARFLLARGETTASGPRRCSARPRRSRGASACRPARPDPTRSAPRAGDAALPDGLSPREVQILAPRRPRPQQPRDRQELTISEHTAANHIRSILRKTGCANRTEAASYAHRHAARLGLTGGYDPRHAAVHDRAHVRRPARPQRRRRQAHRGDQRRRGRPLALLVPERRPATHLLPL